MHTTRTPLLSEGWDFQIDSNGEIVMAENAEATCQNVCNECRCFSGDLYFFSDHGIAWFDDQLGLPVQTAITTSRLRTAAESVPGVVGVSAIELKDVNNEQRTLTGTVEIITEEGGSNVRCEIR